MSNTTSKGLNFTLWVFQILLGGMFAMVGGMKIMQPLEEIVKAIPWVTESTIGLLRFIGVSELLGGIGLIFPFALRIKPQLTVWAALGLLVVMVLAAAFHITRGEYSSSVINLVMAGLFGFIAWGRKQR